MSIAREHFPNVFERDLSEARVEARDGVARGLGEAGASEAAGDVELVLYGVLVVGGGEVEGLRGCVARCDVEHGAGDAGDVEEEERRRWPWRGAGA